MPCATKLSLLLLTGLCGSAASAQTVGFPEYPTLSPDGKLVVFAWAEDLWGVPADGGRAVRLTSHPAEERNSAFSPDGSSLAFESDRDGARNIYLASISSSGGVISLGVPQPVTAIDRAQSISGFSSDGKWVLFTSALEPSMYRGSRMYRAPLAGGPVERITPAFGASPHMTPDGSGYIFMRGGNEWERPHYNGSADREVWRYTIASGEFTQITTPDCNDGEGYQLPDGSIIFVSSRDGQNNIYRLDRGATDPGTPQGRGIRRLTNYAPDAETATLAGGVRDFSVSASGRGAVYCVWDQIYTLDLTRPDPTPRRVEVQPSADLEMPSFIRLNADRLANEAALSPDGKTIAIIARGEVFVRSVEENRPTRRVTSTYGRERDLVWSADGTTLYFSSDESGTQGIYQAKVVLSREDLEPKKPEEAAPETAPEGGADKPETPKPSAVAGIAGSWSCTATGGPPLPPDGAKFTLTLSVAGETITGSVDAPGFGTADIQNARFDAPSNLLTFSVNLAGQPATFSLVISGSSLSGAVTAGQATFTVSGSKAGHGGDALGELILDAFVPAHLQPGQGGPRRGGRGPRGGGEPAAPDQPAAENPPAEGEAKPEEKKPEKPKIDYGKRWAESITFEVTPFIDAPDQNERSPLPSPDGRHLLYLRGYGETVLRDLGTGEDRVLFNGFDEPEVVWAGDSRHIVYSVQDLDFNSDIWVLDALDPAAQPVNITRHPDLDVSPRISADGKVLTFLSDRSGENFEFNVWMVYLDDALEGKDAYDLAEYFKKAADEAKKIKPIDLIDFAAEWTAPEGQTYDTDDAYLRVRRMTSFAGSQGSLLLTPAGDRIVFSANIDGTFGIYSIDYKGGDRKTVTSGGGSNVRLTFKGDTVTYITGGQARSAGVTGGRAETYAINYTMDIDIASQQRQKFLEAARILQTQFYEPTLNGLDWPAVVARYTSLATQTRTGAAFNRVARMLMGELDGSHLGISGGDTGYNAPSPETGYLGVDVDPVPGGFKVTGILKGSPAQENSTPLMEGDVLVSVDGRRFAPDDASLPSADIRATMYGTAGREVLLEIRRESDPLRKYLLITPTGYGAISNLSYDAEVQRRRELVDRLSNGTIGYLHIRSMSEPSTRDFERDLYAAAHGKAGLLIDVRDNGGGSTADILLASLTAPVHAYTVPRGADKQDAFPNSYPRDRRLIYPYQRPITVLINENSYSNAEIFAHSIKTIGRGKLAGTATFGAVISTGAASLIDGTSVRTPFRGWYLPDGTDMEEHGAQPDIDVPSLPGDEAAGRDRQIEEAVRELMQRAAASPDGLWHPGR